MTHTPNTGTQEAIYAGCKCAAVVGEPSFQEDLANNRLLVTLTDWAKAANNGWKTSLDLDDSELREVATAINNYLNGK